MHARTSARPVPLILTNKQKTLMLNHSTATTKGSYSPETKAPWTKSNLILGGADWGDMFIVWRSYYDWTCVSPWDGNVHPTEAWVLNKFHKES